MYVVWCWRRKLIIFPLSCKLHIFMINRYKRPGWPLGDGKILFSRLTYHYLWLVLNELAPVVKKSLWFRADNLKPLLGFGCCLVMIRIGFRAGDPIMALPESSLNQINVMSASTFITFFFPELIFVLPPPQPFTYRIILLIIPIVWRVCQ